MNRFYKKRWFPSALLFSIGIVLTSAYWGRTAYCFEHLYQYPEWGYVLESKTFKQADSDGKHNIMMEWAEWHVKKEIGSIFVYAILPFYVFGIWAMFIDFRNDDASKNRT